ncbi:MAG: helix-turn-helix domain-containing protein [Gemmatimonadales bacterium]|nr:helix-turn-helix domain-containing protein [Gemmatimonadales bacterium]
MAAATVAAVRAQSEPLASLGWPYGILVVPAPGGQRVVLFANRRWAGWPAAFGLEMSAAHVADQVWAAAFRGSRLVPRHLLATVPSNPEYLAIEVSAPDGQRLYASGVEYADGPTDALSMPPWRGGVTVRARLNPRVKAALIPGGVPARRPDRELAFIARSVGLIAAVAGVGFRAADLARVRAVDTHVAALRQRLERDPADARLILTAWKAGYRLALDSGRARRGRRFRLVLDSRAWYPGPHERGARHPRGAGLEFVLCRPGRLRCHRGGGRRQGGGRPS